MTTTAAISVLIVDDSALVRHGIRAAIENEPNREVIAIVGEAATAAAALSEAQRLRPEVVLLDLRLPDDNGLNVCRKLRELLPETCVIVLTSATDDESIYGSVVAGAQGYLLKEIAPATLIQCIEDGHAGRPVFSAEVGSRVLGLLRTSQSRAEAATGLTALSPQERRVLAALANCHSNREIATLMNLSENTVKNYIAHIYEKLGVTRRSQAVALYQSKPPFAG